ncbi:MAG: DUF6680 family protein [Alphaproteobacteria bacterium]
MADATWYAIATLAAIVAGPVIAVFMTRVLDQAAERRSRKLDVFRDLMRTRGIRIDPVHVAALNLVEVEFYNEREVTNAYRVYIAHLSAPMPAVEEQDRFFEQRIDLFMNLLETMGRVLKYSFDKRDLERLSYVPQGWGSDQDLQRRNAFYLSQILSGERGIPITNIFGSSSPFPEPPKLEQAKIEQR